MKNTTQSGGRSAIPGPLIELGVVLAVGASGFSYLGYWLDGRYGTSPTWTISGMLLGVAFCVYSIWKAVRAVSAQEDSWRGIGPDARKVARDGDPPGGKSSGSGDRKGRD